MSENNEIENAGGQAPEDSGDGGAAGKRKRAGGWLHALAAALLLVLCLALAYGPAKLYGHIIYAGVIQDITNLYGFHCWDAFSGSELEAGRFPLWNPYNAFGVPHLANMQTAIFYPLNWAKWGFGFWESADWILLFRMWLAGMFTFLFARRALGTGFWPSMIGAVAFMLSGYMTRYVYMSHLNVECLLPLQLYLLHLLSERAGKLRFALASLGFALLVLGGFPEATLYAVAFSSIYFIFVTRFSGRALLLLSASLLVGFLISSVQWLPFAEYLPHAWTYHQPGAGLRHLDAGMSVSLIMPWFFGENDISPAVPFLVPYLGLIPVLLFIYGLFRLRDSGSRAVFFCLAALCLLCFVYGLLPMALLGRVWPFSVTYNDKYAVPVLTLCVALFAAHATEKLYHDDRFRKFGAAAAIVGGWVIASVIIARELYTMGLMDPYMVLEALTVVAIAFMLHLMMSREFLSARWSIIGIFFLCLVGLLYDFQGHKPVYNDDLPDKVAKMEKTMPDMAGVRVHGHPEIEQMFPNLLLHVPVADVRYYDPLYPESYVDYMALVNGLSGNSVLSHYNSNMLFVIQRESYFSPLARLANVGLYVEKEDINPRTEGVEKASPSGAELTVYRDRKAMPREWIADGFGLPLKSHGYMQTLELMTANNPNVLKSVVLLMEHPGEREYDPGEAQLENAIKTTDRVPGKLEMETYSPGQSFLFIANQYLPGWKASLKTGESRKTGRIHQADGPFMALPLDPGKTEVSLAYVPASFRVGLWAALSSLFMALLLTIIPRSTIKRRGKSGLS